MNEKSIQIEDLIVSLFFKYIKLTWTKTVENAGTDKFSIFRSIR